MDKLTATRVWALVAAAALVVAVVPQAAASFVQDLPRGLTHEAASPAQSGEQANVAGCVGSVGPALAPPASVPSGVPGFHAHWYGQSGYPTLCPGESSTAVVAYYNSGTAGWLRGVHTAYLGTWGPEPGQDQISPLGGNGTRGSVATGWPSYDRIAVQSGEWVGPGQVAWFEFTIRAPEKPGHYRLYLRPLIEGVTWLEDFGVYWPVSVLNADGTAPPPPPIGCVDECWPLTGRPHNGGPTDRPAFNARIDNATPARPHFGISEADMIFELLVEGGITRLSAIFHSTDPAVIGSIRSARLSDRYLTPMTGGALVYSGATIEETAMFKADAAAGAYLDLNASYQAAGYYRVNTRPNPHNMMTSSGAVREAMARLGRSGSAQVQRWDFLRSADHEPTLGGFDAWVTASTLTIPYRASATVRYDYDPATRTYARYQHTRGVMTREVDAGNGRAIAAANVVVVYTQIWDSAIVQDRFGSLGKDMNLIGQGRASIFRDGRRVEGFWKRPTYTDAFKFVSTGGEPIYLSPGQTWVHPVPQEWVISSR